MSRSSWYLEGYVGESKRLRRVHLYQFPFQVGRHQQCELTLDSTEVSRRHAELDMAEDQLLLRDLGSTNGSFINHQRIDKEQALLAGDVIHFADQEYRLIEKAPDNEHLFDRTNVRVGSLPANLPRGAREFQILLLKGAVTAAFQPIVDANGNPFAHEMLGRGATEDLPTAPLPLFQIAESLEQEVHLSEMFRQKGLEIAHRQHPNGLFFFNIHPRELADPERLLRCVESIRTHFPALRLVFEMHEAAVTKPALIRRIRDDLQAMNVGLAYDDFGAGQARLIELTEVPPDYVKFDIALVRDIDSAPEAKRQMLDMFQRFLLDMGIATLAEGVETAAEFQVLHDLGVQYYQGYYFGKPSPDIDTSARMPAS
ncbi:EAL domain-containing protein [Thiorhodovibrio frisius]|uniref:EAL domain-containing protein n=1 Tax=Thiorhodovibrio frisius TaxID=631362 RepID=H8YYG2_9GAMM|nr:EAL domain-containing protein [Thiorhodovibrio frisius]EIC23488.1 EAL domain-containing protein [Thiorhodovibrio frisius]WPL23425.1 Cyclic di-GMP phosphodiesterase YfgF [Thiorhodovibrio frisius]